MSDKRHRRSPKGNLAKKQRSDDDSELMSIDEEKDEAAEVGIIQSISLKNFMCHSNLEFNFKPHVNFIIGKNGSGKSAILTGIVVGLGGKAAVTERARNFKTFIKNGKQVAEIAVKLRNYGSEAYKPEEYGSLIIVERKLTADGSSSYKLKNETGAVVSTKREELIHILDQFNIQVDNPVSVLNQETSRSFLNFKSAKDKYMFFLKATQLEQMMQDYTRTDETEKVIRDTLQRKKETLPELEKEVKDWQRRWKFHQSLDDQRKKLDRLRNEFAWAYVVERERELDEKLNLVEEQKNCTPKFKSKVTETQENIGKLNKEKEKIQFELQGINVKTSAIQQEHINLKRELLARKTSLRNKELELRKASNEISPAKKEIDSLKKRIEELRMGDQQDYAIERQRRLKEIQLLEQQKAGLLEEQKSLESSHKAKENLLSKMSEDIYNLRQEEQNKIQQINFLDRTITNLEKSKTNQLRRFGAYMPELLERIELACKQRKFTRKPRGPIGSCIKLRDVQWALAVESCLNKYIYAFCCDNHQDERTLQQIMRSVISEGRKPSIIVCKFRDEVYDVHKYSVKSDKYNSVLEMLEISDPVIANCIIDQRKIESILLIAENEEARNVMIDNVPHQCREAFTLVGDHLFPSPIFRYYSSTKKGADFLQGSVEDKIKEKKEEILDLRHRQRAIQSDINEANQKLKANKSNYNEITNNLAKVRQKIMELNVKISELNIEEPKPIDVTVLEEELETMQNHLKGLEQYEARLLEDRDNAKIAAGEIETEYNRKDEELGSLFSHFDPLKDALGNLDSQIEQAKLHKQHYDKKLKDHEKKVAELEKDYGATKALLEANIKKANEISPRVRTRQSSHSIEIEINQIEKQLKQEEKSQGNREEVTSKYFETKRKYDQIKNDVKKIEDFIRSLNTIMIERKKAYDCFRKQLSMRVKYLFITSLAQRNYSGKIDFNHTKSLLEIRVQPNSKSTMLNEDLKALSGGERSFTTVCFILALWDAVESPFRILDEFDVFMDMVNRRISMDMMLDTAMHKTKHQFIFLSPLDMTSLPASRRIQICRMPDPDRNENKPLETKQN